MDSMFEMLSEQTDEQLCIAFQGGNSEAGEALASRCGRQVRRCAHSFFLAGGDSEDLLQEGMLGLIQAMREFRPEREASFRTFAEVCIRNRLCSVVRAAGAGKHKALNDSVPLSASVIDGQPQFNQLDPEELLIDRERASALLERVHSRLSPLEVRVLDLYLAGLSCGEIAQAVGKPYKSVDNAIQRIRRKVGQHNLFSGDISKG